MNILKKNGKLIIGFVAGAVMIGSITAYATYNYFADGVGYTRQGSNVENVEQALNELYSRTSNNQGNYTDNELSEILRLSNQSIKLSDVITPSFASNISSSKDAAKILIDSSAFRSRVTSEMLSNLNIALVPTLSNNNNVIYSSQYDTSVYAGYRAFSSSNAWCTSSGKNTNQYIGYNFNTNINVRAAKFYNGGVESIRCKQVKLQYSDDNSTWSDASDIYTCSDSSVDVFLFNTKDDNSHQYWRIYIINGYHSSYLELNKLQFYGV